MKNYIRPLIIRIAKGMPGLSMKLHQAGMKDTPEGFVTKTLKAALMMTLAFSAGIWMFLSALNIWKWWLSLLFPAFFFIIVMYFSRIPDVQILKKKREINSEIIFAGRFLIIEMESGIPLYDAFKNVSKHYKNIGKYFAEITTKIDLGTEVEAALTEAIESTPSANFRKILWQIINAQQTGADISSSLKGVVEQITREQIISIKEYGRKLNPLAMFYMIIAVILPSIGITMFIIMSTFMNLTISLSALLVISLVLTFIQYMFLALMKSARPAVEL